MISTISTLRMKMKPKKWKYSLLNEQYYNNKNSGNLFSMNATTCQNESIHLCYVIDSWVNEEMVNGMNRLSDREDRWLNENVT